MPKSTNKRLNIAFVIDDGLDKPDGVQQYVLTLGRWLESKGHRVNYLAGQTKRKDIRNIVSLSKNIKVKFNGNTLSTPQPASKRRIKKLLSQQKFDILHVQVPYSPFMAGRVIRAASKNTKIIGTFHVLPVGKLQYLGTKILGWMLRYNLRKFDNFLSVSEPAHNFAEATFKINSRILPNPVDIKKFKPETLTRKKEGVVNIVFLGRLVHRKGCMQLLKAVNELLESNEGLEVNLDICGDGDQRHRLEAYINATRLKKITTLHGFVSEEEKIKFLNKADFAVFPSISGESFGIVLIEAMAANSGVVLAGNNPGYASVMSNMDECLFDPLNPGELADKLAVFIKDKKAFESMHSTQQESVKSFDINMIGPKLLKIYKVAK